MDLKKLYRGVRNSYQSLGAIKDEALSILITDITTLDKNFGKEVGAFDIYRLEKHIKISRDNFDLKFNKIRKDPLDFTSFSCYATPIIIDSNNENSKSAIKLVQIIDSSFLSEPEYRKHIGNTSNSLNKGFDNIFQNYILIHNLCFKNRSIVESTKNLRRNSLNLPVYNFPK